MESLSTFSACLPPPIQYGSSRRLLSIISLQRKICVNRLERTNNFKAGSIRQLGLSGFEDGTTKRSTSQVMKAGEAEAPVQNETLQQEAEKASAVAETKKGEGKFWVLRSVNEGDGKNQVIISGDGILVGAAPVVEGSTKPFVVDFAMVSSVHARVYGKERSSYPNTVLEYFVMDLGSTNGTYLNRSKLRPQTEVKLSRGDTLKFGDERATFVVDSQN